MDLLSKRVNEQPKALDLFFERAYSVGFPSLACEQSAHVADENAEGAYEVTSGLRRRAGACECRERFFHARFDRPHKEDVR